MEAAGSEIEDPIRVSDPLTLNKAKNQRSNREIRLRRAELGRTRHNETHQRRDSLPRSQSQFHPVTPTLRRDIVSPDWASVYRRLTTSGVRFLVWLE